MRLALSVVLLLLGLAFLATSFLVYESEDRRLQNRLADYWLRLEYQREKTYALEKTVLTRTASRLDWFMSSLFGERLLSWRAIVMSTSVSLGCLFAVGTVVVSGTTAEGINMRTLVAGLALLQLAVIGLFPWLPAVASLIWLAFYGVMVVGGVWQFDFWSVFVIPLVVSVASDFGLVALLRTLLRRTTRLRSARQITLYLALWVALVGIVIGAPASLIYMYSRGALISLESSAYRESLSNLTLLNLANILLVLGLLLALGLLFMHHMLWQLVLRWLYDLESGGAKQARRSFRAIGLAMVLVSTGLSSAIDLVRRLLGS